LARGLTGFKTAGGGMAHWLGTATGSEALKAFGEDVIHRTMQESDRYQADVGTYKEIDDLGDVWTYAKETFGELLPSIMSSLVSGGVGGAAGRYAAGRMAQNLVEKYGKEEAKRRAAGVYGAQEIRRRGVQQQVEGLKRKGTERGALGGVFVDSGGQNLGHIQRELVENDLENPVGALMGAAVAGGLDAGDMYALFKPIFSRIGSQMAQGVPNEALLTTARREMGRALAVGSGLEAMINPAQEVISMAVRDMADATHKATQALPAPLEVRVVRHGWGEWTVRVGSDVAGFGSLDAALAYVRSRLEDR
jgi:hypothetical protein